MSEWKEYKLGDLISIKGGFSYKGEYIGTGDKFLLGMGCVSYSKTFLQSGARPYSGDCSDRFYAKPFDIVLATRQQSDNLPILGLPAIIPQSFWGEKVIVGTNLYKVDNYSEVDNKYLYWLMRSPNYINYIHSCSKGSTVKMITKDAVESFVFMCPPKEERDFISGLLWQIEDKIDVLNRQNQTLESMAEALFRHYFFDNSADKIEDVQLGEVVETMSGGTPFRKKSQYYTNGTINWIKSKELIGTYIFETEEMITEEALSNSSAKYIPASSILIAMYGANVGEYGITAKPMTCNQAICALIPNKAYPFTYLYLWTKTMKPEFINLSCGAAQQNISQIVIRQQYVCGDRECVSNFHNTVVHYFDKIKSNQSQILTITKLRDSLLTKLMSNEINL